MYTVIKRQDKELKSLFTSADLGEAERYLETYTYDFIASKVGESALKYGQYNDNVVSYPAVDPETGKPNIVKGEYPRKVPSCLYRKFSDGSRNWASIPWEYFIVRDPINTSIFGMAVMHRTAEPGWWSYASFEEVFFIDITYQPNEYLPIDNPYACEECTENRKNLFKQYVRASKGIAEDSNEIVKVMEEEDMSESILLERTDNVYYESAEKIAELKLGLICEEHSQAHIIKMECLQEMMGLIKNCSYDNHRAKHDNPSSQTETEESLGTEE